MEFTHPAEILLENRIVVAFAVLLIIVGFFLGAKTSLKQEVVERAKENDVSDFQNIRLTAYQIWSNNAWISLQASFGIVTPFQVAIFSVGVVYGALFSLMPLSSYLLILSTFGALELLAVFLSVVSGLLFLKTFIQKLRREPASIIETLASSIILLFSSVVLLVPAAIIEAFLLYASAFNQVMVTSVIVVGSFISLILFFVLFGRLRK